MDKTIREIIIEELKNNNISDEHIKEILKDYEKMPIIPGEIFSHYYYKKTHILKITYMKNLFDLTMRDASLTLMSTKNILIRYIKKILLDIYKLEIKLKEKEKQVIIAKDCHEKLKILLNEIKDSPLMLEMLKDEIIYIQTINESNEENNNRRRQWKYSRLNLNIFELNLLRIYLLNNLKPEEINEHPDKYEIYKAIINIYENIKYYIKKIQYKQILNENYFKIESLNFNIRELNMLRKNCLFTIGDIIEYSKEEIDNLPFMGINTKKKIHTKLHEKNIILLSNKDEIEEKLQMENAGIIKSKTFKK